MHITQPQVRLKNFPVYETLEKYLFNAGSKGFAEKASLKSQFISTREFPEPDYTPGNSVNDYKI